MTGAGWEFQILYFLQNLHNPWLDQVMEKITLLGDRGLIWILTGVALLCFSRTRKMGAAVLLSLLCGYLVGNLAIKNLVARQRPCWIDSSIALLVQNPNDFSFPSGHALASFEGALSIWLVNRKWGAIAIILALLIAFSRLYLFVHFPTDVLAGMILGILIAWSVHKVLFHWRALEERRKKRT